MSKKKSFKVPHKQTARLQVKGKAPLDVNSLNPIFSLYHMKYGSKNCLSSCDTRLKAKFTDKILMLSQITWKEVFSAHKEGIGKENIPINQFKIPLPKLVTPDIRSLMVFQLSKSERMAGIKIEEIYHVLVVGNNLYDH